MTAFGRFSLYQDNAAALAPPTVNNDLTQGYSMGSLWFDTTNGVVWVAQSVAAGAAVWRPNTSGVLASLIGANMNVTTDQPLVSHIPAGKAFYISRILMTNVTVSLTTAAGGVYSAAAKGGTVIVAATQAYTALSGTATQALALTLATGGTANVFSTAPTFSLTTAQGAAATADIYMMGDILPHG
jgi:hypothetical protein